MSVHQPTRWDLLTVLLACVILQYVWRVQEVFTFLHYVQFTSLISVGALGLFLLDGGPKRRPANLQHEILIPMIAILVLATLSVPTSIHARISFDFLTKNFVKTIVLVVVLAASVRDRADVERFVRALVLGGATYIVVSLIAAAPDMGRLGGNGGRGSYDPNDLGLVTVSTLPMCIYLVRRGAPRMDRIIGACCAALLLIGTARTGSRGAFLALIAISVYCLFELKSVRRSTRIRAFAFATVMIAVFGGSAYRERIETLADPTQDYNWSGQAKSGRMEIWKRGVGYMLENPLLGVGMNAFFVAEGHSEEAMERRQEHAGFKWSAAHNSYLQIGAELGVPALIFFLRLLWLSLREARRVGKCASREEERLLGQCFSALIIGYLVAGSFLSQAYSPFLYFSLGTLIGLSRVTRQAPQLAVPRLAPAVPTTGGYVRVSHRRPEGWIRLSNS